MALPKLEVPTYEIELPISKQKLKYRPFLVKEQKMLLMAMESGDSASVQHSIREILTVCTLSDGFNIDILPIIDVEYYFLHLRAKSIGEVSESKYRCNNVVTDDEGTKKECGNIMESKVNLLDIKPVVEVEVEPEIKLDGNIIVKMKLPEFGVINDSTNLTAAELTFKMIANCIDYIYDGEQFYYGKETPIEELVEFIESLNQQQFEMMENFFNNMPRLEHKVVMKCSKCGFDHSFNVEGLENFFG